MEIKTHTKMSARDIINKCVDTAGNSAIDGSEVRHTLHAEYREQIELIVETGLAYMMKPDTMATVTITVEFDDDQVKKYDV